MTDSHHPDLEPLAFLLGSWSGEGAGEYPTIEPFSYRETAIFGHNDKPFIAYLQRTTHPELGYPMHGESGYLRPASDGRVEAVLAHPTGLVEMSEGVVDGTTIRFVSTIVAGTPTAKEVSRIERDIVVEGGIMRYEVRMAAVGLPLTHHLSATLVRRS